MISKKTDELQLQYAKSLEQNMEPEQAEQYRSYQFELDAISGTLHNIEDRIKTLQSKIERNREYQELKTLKRERRELRKKRENVEVKLNAIRQYLLRNFMPGAKMLEKMRTIIDLNVGKALPGKDGEYGNI